MVKLGDAAQTPLSIAQSLSEQGLQVFPARYRDKTPLVKWRDYKGSKVTKDLLLKWFRNRQALNFWVLTGRQSGFVVVDCDTPGAEEWWRERLPGFDTTARVATRKGKHVWFRIPESWDSATPIASWSVHPKEDDDHGIGFDFRADETGVIVPPSIHESGFGYKWEVPLDQALDAPIELLDGTFRAQAPSSGSDENTTTGTGGATRSMLSRLLSNPPGAEGSGRNDWLARVAGHYAKTYHNQHDLYEAHCAQANATMGSPLEESEFNKTIGSVWKGEHDRNQYRSIDASCGYIMSGTTIMLCQVVVNKNDEKDYEFVEYADFDLNAKGVMQDEAGRRTYWAEIVRKNRRVPGDVERIDVILRAEVLGDDRGFRKFLAGYACTVVPPDNMWPKAGSPGTRIQRYLESQRPPVVEITPALGYHRDAVSEGNGGFITHDDVITAEGRVSLASAGVRADPRLRSGGLAAFSYGFEGSVGRARNVLADVLTFHHDPVTSVFGAWWAACLLKPQIEERTSLFPFMAIEAPSESGKTNGFFNMMLQLGGSTRGEIQPTKAALRDMAASNRNGAAWIDDLDDPAYLGELLRAATSGGALAKMGEDRESVKNTPIVSPIVISGEALGIGAQKALVDRAVILKAPSPTDRMSLYRPDEPQWNDIIALREQFPDGLHTVAGWYVQEALKVVPQMLDALKAGRIGGTGRVADKVAILRAGARLLDHLVGTDDAWEGGGHHAATLEGWLSEGLVDESGAAVSSQENALTYEVLPWAMRHFNFPDKITAQDGELDTPVAVKRVEDLDGEGFIARPGAELIFRPDLLADAWEQYKRGRVSVRTASKGALTDQAEALKCGAKRVKVSQSGGRLAYYRVITDTKLIERILERARGL